jgi:type I restriction enzyme S subunit
MKTVKLGEENVAEVILGQSPPSSAYNGTGHGLPFFQGKADFGLLHPIPRVWCDAGQKFAKPGDVLMSVRAPVGDVNVALGDCVIGRGIAAIRAGIRSDPWFLYFALAYSKPILESRATGSTFASVNKATLVDLDIPLPEMPEQVAIGSVLRLITEKIEQENVLITTAQDIKRASMRELFTRGLRGEPQKETEIGLVPESWVQVAFYDLGEIVTGTTPPTKERTYYDDGTIPFISPGDIDHGFPIALTQKHITEPGLAVSRVLPAGTTCVVCIGSTIGKVGRTTAPASATNQQINAIIPGASYDQNYVSHLLTYRSDIVRNAASPSPVPILSKGTFEKLVLFTSTDPDEQAQIAAILDALDRKIALHRQKRAVLEELFQSLLHKLMTGEIAVSDLDLSALSPASTQYEEATA